MFEHFSELLEANALNVCVYAVACLIEQIALKLREVVFNALRSVQADFLDR